LSEKKYIHLSTNSFAMRAKMSIVILPLTIVITRPSIALGKQHPKQIGMHYIKPRSFGAESESVRMETSEAIVSEYLRPVLADLLQECTESQQRKFGRIFPQGVESMPAEKIPHAIALCRRTIKKNNE
jgi:hypothetical protein